jgi:hypothetical protein
MYTYMFMSAYPSASDWSDMAALDGRSVILLRKRSTRGRRIIGAGNEGNLISVIGTATFDVEKFLFSSIMNRISHSGRLYILKHFKDGNVLELQANSFRRDGE